MQDNNLGNHEPLPYLDPCTADSLPIKKNVLEKSLRNRRGRHIWQRMEANGTDMEAKNIGGYPTVMKRKGK
jgi:hypothetical protein